MLFQVCGIGDRRFNENHKNRYPLNIEPFTVFMYHTIVEYALQCNTIIMKIKTTSLSSEQIT